MSSYSSTFQPILVMRLIYFTTLALVFTLTNCTPDSSTQTDCLAKDVAGFYICQDVKLNGNIITTTVGAENFVMEATDCNQIKFILRDSETFEVETSEIGTGQIAGGDNTNEFTYSPNTKIIEVTYHATNNDVYVLKAKKQD